MSKKRSSASARVLAALALVCGALAVYLIVGSSLGGEEAGGGGGQTTSRPGKQAQGRQAEGRSRKPRPKFYVVQNGDTLTSIARKTGVSVERIQRLNPGVDPQILGSGEKLKLR